MGVNLLWTGLTMVVAVSKLFGGTGMEFAGAIIMIIGLIALWLNR